MKLTDAQEQRALTLHFASFVFDFSPHGEPFVITPRVRAAMEAEILKKRRLGEILRRMWGERLAELREEPDSRSALRGLWHASGVNAVQVTLGGMELQISSWDALIRDAARWYERARVADDLTICTAPAQLVEAWEKDSVGVMLGLQDTLPIGTDLGRLETLHALGVRIIQLTYNRRNLVGDGCVERHQSGLSRFGVDLLNELNRLGIVVDLSHCGYRTTLEGTELGNGRVAFTHVCAGAISNHPRAKSDEQLHLLAAADGYVGIVAVPFFLRTDRSADIEDMMDHLEHVATIVGAERVGIATDWGFWSTDFPQELYEAAIEEFRALGFRVEDGIAMNSSLGEFVCWDDWPHITRGLVARGFSDEEIRGILGQNWVRFLERARIE